MGYQRSFRIKRQRTSQPKSDRRCDNASPIFRGWLHQIALSLFDGCLHSLAYTPREIQHIGKTPLEMGQAGLEPATNGL